MTKEPWSAPNPIKFEPGNQILVVNSKHRSQTPILFRIQEVNGYKAALLLYGTILPHEIYVPSTHGRVKIPERPSCPVVSPPYVVAEVIEAFVAHVGGVPWYFVHQRGDSLGIPILNGPIPNAPLEVRDRQGWMIERAAKLVDAFESFLLYGDVDQDYRQFLDGIRGVKQNSLWTPE